MLLVLVVVVTGNDVLVDPVVLVVVVGVEVLVDPVVLPVVVDVIPVVTVVLTGGVDVVVLGPDELCPQIRLPRQGYANAGEAYSSPPTIMTVPTASAIAIDRLRMRAPPTRKVVCAMDPSSQ